MDNSRFLKVVIIVLLIVNIGTLTFMWMQRGHMPPAPPPPPAGRQGDVAEFLNRELKLSDAQEQQYSVLRKEHHEGIERYNEAYKGLRDRFFELLRQPNPDSLLVNQLADSIAHNSKNIELITFYHFKKVRAICTTDEQRKRFDEVIGEALHSMAPRPPRPPGGPHGHPDGPPPPQDRR